MTLLLTRSDVADLLPMDSCIEAVEHAFKLHGEGRTDPPGILGIHGRDGSFHIKAGILDLGRPYFAAKTNANSPGNPERFGLPTIQGVLLLAEAERATPLALMNSAEITALRTDAATAVAARHLVRPEAAVVTVCGCGRQGWLQLCALASVLSLTRAYAADRDSDRAEIRLAPSGKGTRLTMIHSEVPASRASSLTSGWKAYFWALLRRYLKRRSAK
jgi:alanine dehydrogenase